MNRKVVIFSTLVMLIALGCSVPRHGEPFTRDVDLSAPQLVVGQRAFSNTCYQCHPAGEAGYGKSLTEHFLPGWYIGLRVRNGWGGMPAFDAKQISDAQLDAVVNYVQALRDR